jgi:predicted kinase
VQANLGVTERPLPPLLLTGGPAVGKSTTGRRLAESRARAAFIDVDDVRQLVVAGAHAPWRSPEGTAQAALGAENACGLAQRFLAHGFDVVVVDVLTAHTAAIYRRELPTCRIIHLLADLDEARRRAGMRRVWLTDDEFELLHQRDSAHPPDVDAQLQVAGLDLDQQVAAVAGLWGGGTTPAGVQ